MPSTARSALGWAVAFPLLVVLILVVFLRVAAPGFSEPLFDSSVAIAGMPAGLVLVGLGWLAVSVGTLAWMTITHRAGAGLASAFAMVVVVTTVLLVPMVVTLIKGLVSGPAG